MHPLEAPWSLFAHTLSDASTYSAAYTHLATVATCEEWGSLWAHVPGADVLARADRAIQLKAQRIVSFSFFRDDVKPEWEHPQNHGGATLTARVTLAPERAQDVWTTLCADCARGVSDDGVLGVQVSQKRGKPHPTLKFDVWLHASCDAARMARLTSAATGLAFALAPRDGGTAPPPARLRRRT